MSDVPVSAIVVGGGFYGASIAAYLAKRRGLKRIMLIERDAELMARASHNNQARVHAGYHYPRSYTTAYRSRVNYPHFLKDFPSAVGRDLTTIYAIARSQSKVTAHQFVRFNTEIGARLEPAPAAIARLFNPKLIERAFLVDETTFDATRLARRSDEALKMAGVDVRLHSQVENIRPTKDGLEVSISSRAERYTIPTRLVFNCTYSGLNQLTSGEMTTTARLKHEIAEMALLMVPPELQGVGITIMDGPFFSVMPFPARGLHTLSHVRYTPHMNWIDESGYSPYEVLNGYRRESRVERMLRDASRFLPILAQSTYVDSLWEVKTVLTKNEVDDGRPILFEKSTALPGLYSVLGGKIDNVYDILELLDADSSISGS